MHVFIITYLNFFKILIYRINIKYFKLLIESGVPQVSSVNLKYMVSYWWIKVNWKKNTSFFILRMFHRILYFLNRDCIWLLVCLDFSVNLETCQKERAWGHEFFSNQPATLFMVWLLLWKSHSLYQDFLCHFSWKVLQSF